MKYIRNLDLKLISIVLAIISVILIIIAIYYKIISEKRKKDHICKLEKDMKDAQDITDEEYTKLYKKYKKESGEIFIKPNSILRRLFMIIIIFASVSAILYII